MIINQSGAERLLGKGDLFFLSIGDPVRLQSPYLSAEERARFFGQESFSAGFR
jgi:DNA segregation ATPase FtsK/SpoIIIE-like protein